MSVVSGVAALTVDELDGHAYLRPGIEYWNALTCSIIALVTGLVLCRLKRTLLERQAANDQLREALQKLETSTAEIRKLQSGLQTVCAWTKWIKVGEKWMSPDES